MTRETAEVGRAVLVPRHFKPRATDRIYDRGVIVSVSDGVATVRLDDVPSSIAPGREVHCPVGLLIPSDA